MLSSFRRFTVSAICDFSVVIASLCILINMSLLVCSPVDMTGRTITSKRKERDEGMTFAEIIAQMESSGTATLPDSDNRQGEKMSYLVSTAADALKAGQALGANVMIVDPPRRGLEDEVLDELCKPFNLMQDYVETKTMLTIPDEKVNWTNDVETLIYVSCGFDALARDCERSLIEPRRVDVEECNRLRLVSRK